MTLREGSRTVYGDTLYRFFTEERNGEKFTNCAWMVKDGETRTVNDPTQPTHGWPIGYLAPLWMLARMSWEDD